MKPKLKRVIDIQDELEVKKTIKESVQMMKEGKANAIVVGWMTGDGLFRMSRAGYNRDQLWILEGMNQVFKRQYWNCD